MRGKKRVISETVVCYDHTREVIGSNLMSPILWR